MFTFPIPPHFRPQDHGWDLAEACRPGRLAPPSKVWLRWVVPYKLPETLLVHSPDDNGKLFAHYMGVDQVERMALADLLNAIS